jgi:hypothetical protein
LACVSLVVLAAGFIATPAIAAHTEFPAGSPFTGGSDVVTEFPTCAVGNGVVRLAGPLGVIADTSHIYATDYCNGTTYRFPASGGSAIAPEQSAANGLNFGMTVSGGIYYGVSFGNALVAEGLYSFDPSTLALGAGQPPPLATPSGYDVVTDPRNRDLYIGGNSGLYRIQHPLIGATVTLVAGGIYGGMGFAADGSELYATRLSDEQVVGFPRVGEEISGTLNFDVSLHGHIPDGVTAAFPNTKVNGVDVSKNLFVDSADGTIERIDVNNANAVSIVASGGTRGDQSVMGAEDCLYVTQSSTIERMSPCLIPVPTVTEVAPNEGPEAGGTSVTITGTHFNEVTAVKFGATNATSYKVESRTSIKATAPAGTGTVDVTVTTVGGTSETISADHYTYPKPCAPGSYSTSGFAPCKPAPKGFYVASSGATEATPCNQGFYQPKEGQTSCLEAEPGHYVGATGQSSQTACPAGYYQPNKAANACLEAEPGHYVPSAGQASQTACPAGFYQPGKAASSCTEAEAGHYVATRGQTSQTPCDRGFYQPSMGQSSCKEAESGHYVASPGQANQTACAAGLYQPNKGASSCLEAEPGHFVASPGQASQTPCSAGFYQPAKGATSCQEAQVGYYVSSPGSSTQTKCPSGTTTSGTGSTSASDCHPIPLHVTTTSLPEGSRGTPYSASLQAEGGSPPYKWKKLGALPKGLKLSKTGSITGTPSTKIAAGSYSISVQVTDSAKKGKHSASATLTLKLS